MTFDGARAFFGILKWLGLVCAVMGAVATAAYLFDGARGADIFLWTSLFGAGLGTAAFGMLGQMIASIATDIQSMRELAQAKAKAGRA